MARLHLFVEGQTEQTFASVVLAPHLANYGVYLGKAILTGNKYETIKNIVGKLLAQEKGTDIFFSTMIDLYAIGKQFPDLAEAEKLRHLPQKRVELLEKSFGEAIGDPRFIPYFQLHEYEAYLFVAPHYFSHYYDNYEKEIAALEAIAAQYETPELINDGVHSSPSKRILAHLPRYKKPLMGAEIARQIGLEAIRAKCPHFSGWLSHLEKLGDKKSQD